MPAPTTLNQALEILNTSMKNLGYTEEVTAENLDTIGVYDSEQVNKIVKQMNLVLEQRFFMNLFNAEKNAFRKFMVNMTENGFGILDVYQEFIDGAAPMWNNTDEEIYKDLVSRAPEKIQRHYHVHPIEKQFKATIDTREYSKVFTTYGLPRFIDVKISNLNASAEYWLKNQIIGEAQNMGTTGDAVYKQGYNLTDGDGVMQIIEDIRATVNDMTQPTANYNKDGIVAMSDNENQLYIITTPEHMERLRNRAFAGAFNLTELQLPVEILYAPNGTNLGKYQNEDVLFLVLDRRAIVAGIKTWRMTNFPVPNTLYENNWLTVEGLLSHNTFFGCVAFTGTFGEYQKPTLYVDGVNLTIGTTTIADKTVTPVDTGAVLHAGSKANVTVTYKSGEAETIPVAANGTYTVPALASTIFVKATA